MNPSPHIIVTGATSGLGQAVAQGLVARGDTVTTTGRRAERLAILDGAAGYPLDLTDKKAVEAFCKAMAGAPLDGLILNAGVTWSGHFTGGDMDVDDRLITTNITANIQLLRGLLPALTAAQGRVLLVASVGGLTPLPYQAVYSGTKAFIINFGLALREELRPTGVQVGIFAPGGIATEMTDIPQMDGLRNELAPVEDVARAAIAAYDTMAGLSVPGAKNKLLAAAAKLMPRGFMARQGEKIYRPES